jgi:hypothetical protein
MAWQATKARPSAATIPPIRNDPDCPERIRPQGRSMANPRLQRLDLNYKEISDAMDLAHKV